jgi:hypothetical protein
MRKCKNCDTPFDGRQQSAEFCSDRCRNTHKKRMKRRRHKAPYELSPERAVYKKEYDKEYRKKPEYKANRREYDKVYKQKPESKAWRANWEKTHPEKIKANRAVQFHRRRGQVADLTLEQWQAALSYFDNKCAYCGVELTKADRDHFIPAKHGGGLTVRNVVPACPTCNRRKNAKNPLDWLVTQARGLVAYVRVMQYLESHA